MKKIILYTAVIFSQLSIACVVSDGIEDSVIRTCLFETKSELEKRLKSQIAKDLQVNFIDSVYHSYVVMICFNIEAKNPQAIKKIISMRRHLVKGLRPQVTFLESASSTSLKVAILSMTTPLSLAFEEVLDKFAQYKFSRRLFIIPYPKEHDQFLVSLYCKHRRRLESKVVSSLLKNMKSRLIPSFEMDIKRTKVGLLFSLPIVTLTTERAIAQTVFETSTLPSDSPSLPFEQDKYKAAFEVSSDNHDASLCWFLAEDSCWSPRISSETPREALKWQNKEGLKQLMLAYDL